MVSLTLQPEEAQTHDLSEVPGLDDVTAIRLEVLAMSGAKSAKLDVDILGCLKGESRDFEKELSVWFLEATSC